MPSAAAATALTSGSSAGALQHQPLEGDSPHRSHLPSPEPHWLRREARVVAGGCNVLRHARLGRQPHVRAHVHVVSHGAAPAHHAVVAELRRTAKGAVCANQAAAADVHIVPYLHQVIHLGVVSQSRVAPAAPVDAATCTDLDAVTYQHAQQLGLLAHGAGLCIDKEAESIGTDAHTAVHHAPSTKAAVLNGSMHTDHRTLTHVHASTDYAART